MREAYGVARPAPQLSGLFMAGQSHGSLGIAHILTGDPHERRAIYRISQPVPDGFYTLDNTRRIRDLKDRAFAEARTQKPILEPDSSATRPSSSNPNTGAPVSKHERRFARTHDERPLHMA